MVLIFVANVHMCAGNLTVVMAPNYSNFVLDLCSISVYYLH